MAGKDTIARRINLQSEFDSQVWTLFSRVKQGRTLPNGGQYRRVMTMLEERAKSIYERQMPITGESDWLALALFVKDDRWFADRCEAAVAVGDPLYEKAHYWVGYLIDQRLESAAARS